MKRWIHSSTDIQAVMKPDVLSYKEKEDIANDLFVIVKRYFEDRGSGRPSPRVSYSEYDKKEYTFRIGNGYMNGRTSFVARAGDYKPADLNAFRKEVRTYLKKCGFSSVQFDITSASQKYEWWDGIKEDKLKAFNAIYFAE